MAQSQYHNYTVVEVVTPQNFTLPHPTTNGIYVGRSIGEAGKKAARKLYSRLHAQRLNLPLRKFNLSMITDATNFSSEQAIEHIDFYMRQKDRRGAYARFISSTCSLVPNARKNKYSINSHV